jgi:hypothetical protein
MTQTKKLAFTVGSFLGLTMLVSVLTIPIFREAEHKAQPLPATSQIAAPADSRS